MPDLTLTPPEPLARAPRPRRRFTPAAAGPAPGQVILTRSDALPGLGPVRVLYRKGGVLLVRMPE